MPRDRKLLEFVKQLQLLHGYDLNVESRQGPYPGTRTWEVNIPKTGFHLSGLYAEVMACLRGYQAGFQAGRRYTREEQQGLRALIAEVEARFKAA